MPVDLTQYCTKDLCVYFHSNRAKVLSDLTTKLRRFIDDATSTLDCAIYDLRDTVILGALRDAKHRGVRLRIAYDAARQRTGGAVADPKPRGTKEWLDAFGLADKAKAIPESGGRLMHNKFLVRDDDAVWTGSANFTPGGLQLQDNNCLAVRSAELAANYTRAFGAMWGSRPTVGAVPGAVTGRSMRVGGASLTVFFEPSSGERIDNAVVQALASAHKVRIMAFLMSDPEILTQLEAFDHKTADIRGIFDVQGMNDALRSKTKGGARPDPAIYWWWLDRRRPARFVKVHSHPFGKGPGGENDFHHNKVMILDDRHVITGSYNFSEHAEKNGENIVFIDSKAVAAAYTRYFDTMFRFYSRAQSGA